MTELKDSKTLDNLKAAFAGESQANRRYPVSYTHLTLPTIVCV